MSDKTKQVPKLTQIQPNTTTITTNKETTITKYKSKSPYPVKQLKTNKEHKIQHPSDINKLLQNNNLFPPEIPVRSAIGKSGLMWPRGLAFIHDAAPLLASYSTTGCPTDCGPPWSTEHIITAIKRGAHPTANKPTARKYLIAQTLAKVNENFASIIKWGTIKDKPPPNLKISPIAMIPHKSRDFRAILDLSFQIRIKGIKQPSVNQATNKLAPQKAMAGLGRVLQRIICVMANNYDPDTPFMFAKCDIKDGFWRMTVSEEDSWNFCYILPPPSKNTPIEDIEIVVPKSLQMGWCESPPFFCAATETSRDIIQYLFQHLDKIPTHNMEHCMLQNADKTITIKPSTAQDIIEVYVDDFISATNQLDFTHLQQLSRAVLHGIHSIFPPPSVSKHCGGDPISQKKMDKGEGTWAYEKEILGWTFNGKDFTIFLDQTKSKKLQKLLKQTAKKSVITRTEMQQVMGKLNHTCIGLPSGRGLLSPLNNSLKGTADHIKITPSIKQALLDWVTLTQRIATRPTSVLELTPAMPWFLGYVDSSKQGVGGVWVNGTHTINATVWRHDWPQEIQEKFVSTSNPNGTISISDLEMAGVLIGWLVLENISPVPLQHAHIGISCDNTPAVAWASRLASSKSTAGNHLCRALALRQHVHRASPLLTISIAGINNDMADVASRAAKHTSQSNSHQDFLSMFSSKFPLPQKHSWHLYHLPSRSFSRVTSCLLGKPLTMASWIRLPNQDKNIGSTGSNTPQPSNKIPSSTTLTTCKKLSSSQLSLRGSGQVISVEEAKSAFLPSLKRSRPWQRPSNWLESQARSTKQKGYTKSQWHGSWKATGGKTPPPCHSLRFPSKFPSKCNETDTKRSPQCNKQQETSE
jgi:hypothetical protein